MLFWGSQRLLLSFCGGGVGWGGFAKSFSCPTQPLCWGCVTLCCGWGCDNNPKLLFHIIWYSRFYSGRENAHLKLSTSNFEPLRWLLYWPDDNPARYMQLSQDQTLWRKPCKEQECCYMILVIHHGIHREGHRVLGHDLLGWDGDHTGADINTPDLEKVKLCKSFWNPSLSHLLHEWKNKYEPRASYTCLNIHIIVCPIGDHTYIT